MRLLFWVVYYLKNRGNSSKDNKYKEKANKGKRWMPRLLEAKKDVTSCEKLGGGAHIP